MQVFSVHADCSTHDYDAITTKTYHLHSSTSSHLLFNLPLLKNSGVSHLEDSDVTAMRGEEDEQKKKKKNRRGKVILWCTA